MQAGCPQVEFVPILVAQAADVPKVLALKDEVDGYLIYIITLNWGLQGTLLQIGKLGKPLLVADEYLGGSGVFLCGTSSLRRNGLPAGAVATTRPADLVAVARSFADVRAPGTTPASFAKRCDDVYRQTFAATGPSPWTCGALPPRRGRRA